MRSDNCPEEYRNSFYQFCHLMADLLAEGESKGYTSEMRSVIGTAFCEGEAITKVLRWRKKHNRQDLVKAATHLMLVFHDDRLSEKALDEIHFDDGFPPDDCPDAAFEEATGR